MLSFKKSVQQKKTCIGTVLLTVMIVGHSFGQNNDTLYGRERHWGMEVSVGGAQGGVGISVLHYTSERVAFVGGVGVWYWSLKFSGFPLTDVVSDKRSEATIFVCSRMYATRTFYFVTGVAVKEITASVIRQGEQRSVTLGSAGVPLALGFDLAKKGEAVTASVELGFAMYVGPGADEFELAPSTFSGSSGVHAGLGINIYF